MADRLRSLAFFTKTFAFNLSHRIISVIFRSRRTIILCCLIFLILTITIWQLPPDHAPRFASTDKDQGPPNPNRVPLGQHYPSRQTICQTNFDWLNELDIPFPVKYARRDVVVRSNSSVQRDSITRIDEPLFGDLKIVEPGKASNEPGLSQCPDPLFLDVPAFADAPTDASHIIFGAATTLSRLEESLPFFERWLAHTNARFFVVVTGSNDKAPNVEHMEALQSRMRGLGIAVTLVKPLNRKDGILERYFSLVKILYANHDHNTRWLGFVDDDTFVTSMSALVTALDKYDHTQLQYLGALSEEWWTVVLYGLIGMGGAGIFLSIPLASILDANHGECKQNSRMGFGDHKIYECIQRYAKTPLTTLPGLHQIDIHGDRSGVFESGRQLLTLHHWKEGYWDEKGDGPDGIRHSRWFPMDQMSLVASVCDTCYLQRWQFGPDAILSNGYSISTYPKGALNPTKKKPLRLDKLEYTWVTPMKVEGSVNKGWDHSLGPLRPPLKLEEEKIPYRFLAGVGVDGGVRQYYRHLGKEGDMDSVVELFWIREEAWKERSVTSTE